MLDPSRGIHALYDSGQTYSDDAGLPTHCQSEDYHELSDYLDYGELPTIDLASFHFISFRYAC